jgi:hypothetical protein
VSINEERARNDAGAVREWTVDGMNASRSDADWSWPPSAGVPYTSGREFVTESWAPQSSVRHPWLRVGRWTLLYRRAA